ncbi:MAG: hypothetical protein Q4B01_01515 [Eubacteriales bacterium]|nr:hypothetical protein [Eubacteriales bacterium]
MRKQKAMAILLAAGIFCAIGSYGAGPVEAYLKAQDETENVFRPVETVITVEEEFDPPTDPKPGDVITKRPVITNRSETDCYVRVRVHFSSQEAEKLCEPLQIGNGWALHEDGFYYWKEVLPAHSSTGDVFTFVKLRSDISKEELIPFTISVYAEAVQAVGTDEANAWKNYQ